VDQPGVARILVVDDEVNVLETISTILVREGYQVEGVTDVRSALARLRQQTYDALITDLRLDTESGLSLLAEVRQHSPETITLVLTGYASLQSAIEAIREGVYAYLVKPCDVNELKLTVKRSVERSVLSRELHQRMTELHQANTRLSTFNATLREEVAIATAELQARVAELAAAKAALEAEQQRRAEFISLIAHELGQPVTSIHSYAQLLARPGLPDDRQERARQAIASESRRMLRLVRDLSEVARLGAGRFALQLASVDLAEIVRTQVGLLNGVMEPNRLRVEAPNEAVVVSGDQDRLAQVVSNLLHNAVKYAPTGPIWVTLTVDGKLARLAIRDEGVGLASDRLAAIFEPSVRVAGDEVDSPPGLGLGLYVARSIIEAHGGQIWAESPGLGRGATFVVVLPLGPSAAG
jgi:signal transduction histidine kinase